MRSIIIILFLALASFQAIGQTDVTADKLRAKVSLQIGAKTEPLVTDVSTVMPGTPLNTQIPSTKLLYDWVNSTVIVSGATAGGDLSGTYPNPTVDGLQGRPISGTAPSPGQVLTWSGSQWVPSTVEDQSATNELQSLSIVGQDLTLSNGGGTVAIPAGADGNGIYSGSGTVPLSTVVDATNGVQINVPGGYSFKNLGTVGDIGNAFGFTDGIDFVGIGANNYLDGEMAFSGIFDDGSVSSSMTLSKYGLYFTGSSATTYGYQVANDRLYFTHADAGDFIMDNTGYTVQSNLGDGIKYAADYDATLGVNSLTPKRYVDARASKWTDGGTTTYLTSTTDNVAIGGTSATAALHVQQNGALSQPIFKTSGTWITGGTATTTKPAFLIEPSAATSTAWSTSGTGLGINAASGFTGNLFDAQVNGGARFKVASTGNTTTVGNSIIGDGSSDSHLLQFQNTFSTGTIRYRRYSSNSGYVFNIGGSDLFYMNNDGQFQSTSISTGGFTCTDAAGITITRQLKIDANSNVSRTENRTSAGTTKWYNGMKDATFDYYFESAGGVGISKIENATGIFNFGAKTVHPATNTAAGTTGAQTINKPSGTVNFAAGTSSLVVTNSTVTTSSIVFAVVRTSDTTADIKNVVPASGSFTITLTAAATAETSVGFFVIN